jgi:hypothetical protein
MPINYTYDRITTKKIINFTLKIIRIFCYFFYPIIVIIIKK